MPTELDVLLDKVADPTLRANIRSQVERLRAKRTFGLAFESHLPERVRLPAGDARPPVKSRRDSSMIWSWQNDQTAVAQQVLAHALRIIKGHSSHALQQIFRVPRSGWSSHVDVAAIE